MPAASFIFMILETRYQALFKNIPKEDLLGPSEVLRGLCVSEMCALLFVDLVTSFWAGLWLFKLLTWELFPKLRTWMDKISPEA